MIKNNIIKIIIKHLYHDSDISNIRNANRWPNYKTTDEAYKNLIKEIEELNNE